jgi:SAM-dependent methyltransferase
MALTNGGKRRLQEIKKHAVRAILPKWEHVAEPYWPTIAAFTMSYSMGRTILDFCREYGLAPAASRILIVGAYGGRDYHWLTGFGYEVDVLDLGHHPWGDSEYVGDACRDETWKRIEVKYDLIIMCDVLEHLPEDYAALVHAKSALKDGGHVLLSVPYAHDLEPTHVRSYTHVTLTRLLSVAGYEVVWHRARPGGLESTPLTTIFNYAVAFMMPSTELGGRVLHSLLRMEFAINEHTRRWYAIMGRSPQKGITLAARAVGKEGQDYVSMNRDAFIATK